MQERLGHWSVIGILVIAGCYGEEPEFSIVFEGTGEGRVQGPGINCTSTCSTVLEAPGTNTYTATANSGSTFLGWGRSCSGTAASTEVTVAGEGTSCTVTFNLLPVAPPPPPPAPGTVTLEDGFSAATTWNTIMVQTSGNLVDPQTAGSVSSGGSPGAYRSMTHKFTGAGDIWVNHVFGDGTYNPSQQGAITSVDFSADRIVINGPFAGAAVADWFLVVQNNQTFEKAASPNTFSSTTWQGTTLTGLHAADFLPAPGPNFSASGGPMQFGYRRANTNTSAVGYSITHGIDNWRVVIHR